MKNALLVLLICLGRAAFASHLLGGFIQVQQVAPASQQYTIRVILFMDEVNGRTAAQQTNTVQVCFGDGNSGAAQRTERTFTPGNPNTSRNVYTINHTYAGPGTYTALCLVSNRTDGLANVAATLNTPFGLATTFSTSLTNNTPSLPAILSDTAYTFQKAIVSLQATDTEGDSLVYLLAKPQTTATSTAECIPQLSGVASYVFPNDVKQRGTFRINGKSGQLTWDAPAAIGRYDFAITVQEWRKGVLLSQTQYEQVILVIDKANSTPGTIPPYEPAQLTGDGIITGVDNPESSQDMVLTAFPVPVLDQLQVTLDLRQPGSVTLQLVDLAGRIVYETQQKAPVQHYNRAIDVRSLSSGLYLLQAQADGKTVAKKVLIH